MNKTIFITISRGGTARNVLQSDILKVFKASDNRIVILTPAWQDERFLSEFGKDGVIFEKLVEPSWSKLDNFLVGWHKALVYNNSTKLRDLYGVPITGKVEDGSVIKFIFKWIFIQPLSKLRFLKNFFRWLDSVLIKDHYYNELFEKYKPDIVFATSVVEDMDTFVMKQARQRGIKIIAMPKSWDNLSKLVSRVCPDKIIVWADYSKNEAMKFHNLKEKDIIKCGIPQFDFYQNLNYTETREEFCARFGIEQNKKIILFCSEGKNTPYDGEIGDMLAKFINENKIIEEAILLIRPHFMYLGDENKFDKLKSVNNVFIDSGYERSSFKDNWDYSQKQIKNFTNILRYAEVVVTSLSSISLDASAFDKPIINITFDGYKNLSYSRSLRRLYKYEHYIQIVKSEGIWLVDNKEELLNAINSYMKNPSLLKFGREKLRNYFCYKIDGQSGKRVGEAVLNYLYVEK